MNHGLRLKVKDSKIRIDKVMLRAKWLITERVKTTQGFDPCKNAKLEICKLKDRLVHKQVVASIFKEGIDYLNLVIRFQSY